MIKIDTLILTVHLNSNFLCTNFRTKIIFPQPTQFWKDHFPMLLINLDAYKNITMQSKHEKVSIQSVADCHLTLHLMIIIGILLEQNLTFNAL